MDLEFPLGSVLAGFLPGHSTFFIKYIWKADCLKWVVWFIAYQRVCISTYDSTKAFHTALLGRFCLICFNRFVHSVHKAQTHAVTHGLLAVKQLFTSVVLLFGMNNHVTMTVKNILKLNLLAFYKKNQPGHVMMVWEKMITVTKLLRFKWFQRKMV